MKTNILSLLLCSSLIYFALSPNTQAVSPPPDGDYTNGNTAEGANALLNLTPGPDSCCNTAIGAGALFSNTVSDDTAVGINTLHDNTTGRFNTAIGAGALQVNTVSDNTAVGAFALAANTSGRFNTAIAGFSLQSNTTGSNNTATGYKALFRNTTGDFNTANGMLTLTENTTGNQNTANGVSALRSNTGGDFNTATGVNALTSNTSGGSNTATGVNALTRNTSGDFNTASGVNALRRNTNGDFNTATGVNALTSNTSGVHNTANGFQALFSNTTGNDNVALGFLAGNNQTTGSNNVYIGSNILGVAGENSACYIASIFGQTSATGIPVLVGSDNKLGTTTSSKRFKEDIKPMDKASEVVYALKPVTFRYRKELDPQGIQQWGLVAEDVQKVNPALVALDKEGRPYAVRYDQVNAMLLNEFLKERRIVEKQSRKIQEQETTITQLKQEFQSRFAEQHKQIDALTANLQKVSARLQLNKPALQTVLNNQ